MPRSVRSLGGLLLGQLVVLPFLLASSPVPVSSPPAPHEERAKVEPKATEAHRSSKGEGGTSAPARVGSPRDGVGEGDRVATQTEPPPLRFGISPYLSEPLLRQAFEPVLAYLARRTGRPFRLVVPPSYGAMVDLVARGAVDFAYLPPASYVKARMANPRVRLLVTDVLHGVDFYDGYLLVLERRGIDGLDALRGKRLAFVDRDSTSGYLLPLRFFRARHIDPWSYFSSVVFTGSHDASIRALLAGQVDVAAVSSGMLAAARQRGLDLRDVRILAKTGTVPHDVVCAVSSLPEALVQSVRDGLLSLDSRSAEGRAILPAAPQINGWRPGDPHEYDELEDLIRSAQDPNARGTAPEPSSPAPAAEPPSP